MNWAIPRAPARLTDLGLKRLSCQIRRTKKSTGMSLADADFSSVAQMPVGSVLSDVESAAPPSAPLSATGANTRVSGFGSAGAIELKKNGARMRATAVARRRPYAPDTEKRFANLVYSPLSCGRLIDLDEMELQRADCRTGAYQHFATDVQTNKITQINQIGRCVAQSSRQCGGGLSDQILTLCRWRNPAPAVGRAHRCRAD